MSRPRIGLIFHTSSLNLNHALVPIALLSSLITIINLAPLLIFYLHFRLYFCSFLLVFDLHLGSLLHEVKLSPLLHFNAILLEIFYLLIILLLSRVVRVREPSHLLFYLEACFEVLV